MSRRWKAIGDGEEEEKEEHNFIILLTVRVWNWIVLWHVFWLAVSKNRLVIIQKNTRAHPLRLACWFSIWTCYCRQNHASATWVRVLTLWLHVIRLFYIILLIKCRFKVGNTCYSVQRLSSSRLLSKNLKIKIYKTIILPVVEYMVMKHCLLHYGRDAD